MQRVSSLASFPSGVMSAVVWVPQDQVVNAFVGESVTLRCSMKGGSIRNYYNFWYRKTPRNIKNPDPAVYQLKAPKSSNNISVCLYTDFQVNATEGTEPVVLGSNKTVSSKISVLDMEAVGSKSNGLVAWSNSIDFECQNSKKNVCVFSGISCDAKLVEKSFETDMNLNLQNLTVIGFRILLLKMVGFNLLMTLRLWSS
uniref:T-cell receptor alpha chain constant domain-containing protein n=1 Tax=Catagonus wagneri TaxID=51154 RepID=A0A8C3YSJ0_9CETA